MEKITIIIPTHRPQKYFLECLKSLKNQSIEKNLVEIIIILNGEKEPYLSLINNYVQNLLFDNVKIIYTEEKGVSNARNIGLDNAIGDYIVFVDDDDFLSDTFLADLYAKRSKAPGTIVVSNVKTYNYEKQVSGFNFASNAFIKNKGRKFSLIRYRSFFSSVWAKLIPVNVIDKIRFNPTLSISEDAVFMFAISKNINNVLLSEESCIYFHGLNLNSVIRRKSSLISKLKVMYDAIKNYLRIYFSDVKHYNLLFCLNRILASIYCFIIRLIKYC